MNNSFNDSTHSTCQIKTTCKIDEKEVSFYNYLQLLVSVVFLAARIF